MGIKAKLRDLGVGVAIKSYAQEGEDLILRRLFAGRANGFYVDIGAHHPKRFSNTYLLYQAGWRGINVDAMPGSMAVFDKARPDDINIEAALSDCERELDFYIFDEPALNTCSSELVDQYVDSGYRLVRQQKVCTCSLAALLDEHLPQGCAIDLLSIDVEGEDLNVLRSGDWQRYRPDLVLVEALGVDTLEAALQTDEAQFMAEVGYAAVAKTVNTLFFRDTANAAAG